MTEQQEMRFGGSPIIPPSEVFDEAHKKNPKWSLILERAYSQLADRPENKGLYAQLGGPGATIPQIWRFIRLFRFETYCVLTRPLPKQQTEGVSRVEQRTSAQLVDLLKKIQEKEGTLGVPTLHHDGKTGHCITLQSYDGTRDRFIYHDPWPTRSLLCEENNEADVKAQPEGKHWSVTSDELARVLVGCFVFPAQWLRAEGAALDLSYEEWHAGEFFKFFHLRLIEERTDDKDVFRRFAAGPFGDWVNVVVQTNDAARITHAELVLARVWMKNNIVFALDITKSFIGTFAPARDHSVYDEIGEAIWKMRDPVFAQEAIAKDPTTSTPLGFVHTFAGSRVQSDVQTDLAHLSFENQEAELPELCVDYTLF